MSVNELVALSIAWLNIEGKDPSDVRWTAEYRLRAADVLSRLALAKATLSAEGRS